MAAHIVLPWAHRIFSNLKVWALGVYHGLRRKYLQTYLDEFVFRFNRRRTPHVHFAPCSARRRRCSCAAWLQGVDLTGSKGISLQRRNVISIHMLSFYRKTKNMYHSKIVTNSFPRFIVTL